MLQLIFSSANVSAPQLYSEFTFTPDLLASWAVLAPAVGYEVCVPLESIGKAMKQVRHTLLFSQPKILKPETLKTLVFVS